MKLIKKYAAFITTALSMISLGLNPVLSNAANLSEERLNDTFKTAEVDINYLQATGDLTKEEANTILKMLDDVRTRSSSFTYESYDTYNAYNLSPTTHYLAALAEQNDPLDSCDIYFYLNTNIIAPGYLNSSLFTIGQDYATNSALGTATASNASTNVKKITLPFSTTASYALSTSEVFTYYLGTFSSGVQNENKLHKFTSRYVSDPTTVLDTSEDDVFFG